MRTLAITALLAITPLTGCIYYESSSPGCGDWGWDDDCWDEDGWDDDCWDDCDQGCDDPADEEEEEDDFLDIYGFSLSPWEVEQGASYIASLQAADEAVDYEDIGMVHVNGEVTVGAMDARSRELILYLEVAPTAEVGEADVFVTLGDEILLLDQPLIIHEAGSGYEVADSEEPDCE